MVTAAVRLTERAPQLPFFHHVSRDYAPVIAR